MWPSFVGGDAKDGLRIRIMLGRAVPGSVKYISIWISNSEEESAVVISLTTAGKVLLHLSLPSSAAEQHKQGHKKYNEKGLELQGFVSTKV